VEWFSAFKPQHDENHNRYSISTPLRRANEFANASIICLTNIRQTCQLFPKFGRQNVDSQWTTDTVLDQCTSFYINNWASY
ncbi:hypothetical protein C8R45DRAFT_849527, partial [Mycena sanguinolenta]